MSIYRELDPMLEHRPQLAFKGKREHIAKAKTPKQYSDTEIPHSSRDHVILPDTVKWRLILTLTQ